MNSKPGKPAWDGFGARNPCGAASTPRCSVLGQGRGAGGVGWEVRLGEGRAGKGVAGSDLEMGAQGKG